MPPVPDAERARVKRRRPPEPENLPTDAAADALRRAWARTKPPPPPNRTTGARPGYDKG